MALTLPDVQPQIQDGNLGIAPSINAKPHIKVGLSPKGTVNGVTVIAQGDLSTLQKRLGKGGDLVEAAAMALSQGGPIYIVTANPSSYGAPGSVVKTTSAGASTLTIAAQPFTAIRVKIATSGTLGNATLQTSTDGGATYGPVQTSAATAMLSGAPFVTIAMGAGSYVAGDTFDLGTDGTVVFTGTGASGVTISSSSAVDNYPVVISCVQGGALGAATFLYSLDNGNTLVGPILVPSSGKYVLSDTGLLLTFSGTLVAGESWYCQVGSPSYSGTDLTNALNAAFPALRQYGVTTGTLHVVGTPSSVSAAATLAATVQVLLDNASQAYQYLRAIIEVPSDTDTNTAAAFTSVGTLRVGVCAGFCYAVSPINGRQSLVSSAWPVAARLASDVAISEDLGFVDRGALSGVSLAASNTTLPIQRDESGSPALDAARFITLRTISGRQGLYVTNGRLMAPGGSDYTLMQYGLVIDVAAAASRNALLKYLNSKVRVNPAPKRPGQPAGGTIFESDAQSMERWVTQRLTEALVQTNNAVRVDAACSRTQNVLSTQTLPWDVAVLPFGYSKYIPVNVGFLPVTA